MGVPNRFVEWRKQENVRPLVLPDKEKFYLDLQNIEYSFSGRMDEVSINTFIMEAAQLLVNAMELFEMGYFDCAYYALRTAVDVSTTMVFLVDMPEAEQNKWVDKWKNTEDFPMQHQMVKSLFQSGYVLSDMKNNMPEFFNDAKELSQRLNKYVHKQGFQHFYVSRNHSINQNKSQENFINNFEFYLKKCIGVVAVMRLAADPFPVLLMDNEILYRCFESITEPYSQNFVNEYIGVETIEKYKKTNIYQGTYEAFINNEKKNQATFDVAHHQYINTVEMRDILEQLHLLTVQDAISVMIVKGCDKVVKVYAIGGFYSYLTERHTNRKVQSWNSSDFNSFQHSESKYNQEYGEAYISVFFFKDDAFFAEHNEPLTDEDIGSVLHEIKEYEDLFPNLFPAI